MNCGRKARKKIESWIEDVDQKARDDYAAIRALADLALHRERTAFTHGLPGHKEQVSHSAPFQRRKCHRAGVEHGCEPEHRCRHVRYYPERAAEGGSNTRPRTACQGRRERVEHAGSGRGDHDQ
jgi:hypothetical protein